MINQLSQRPALYSYPSCVYWPSPSPTWNTWISIVQILSKKKNIKHLTSNLSAVTVTPLSFLHAARCSSHGGCSSIACSRNHRRGGTSCLCCLQFLALGIVCLYGRKVGQYGESVVAGMRENIWKTYLARVCIQILPSLGELLQTMVRTRIHSLVVNHKEIAGMRRVL